MIPRYHGTNGIPPNTSSFSSAEKRAWYTRIRQNPQKSWGFGYIYKIIVAYLVYDRRLFAYSSVHTWYARTNSKINPTHHGETVSDIHYGIFTVERDACADSAYQALYSADEKEPGVEATPTVHVLCNLFNCIK